MFYDIQGSFGVRTQRMRDDVTMSCCLWLAERMHRMIPDIDPVTHKCIINEYIEHVELWKRTRTRTRQKRTENIKSPQTGVT